MSPNLDKILKAFAKELTVEVTKQVTERLRDSYVADVTAIVKDCLNNDEIYKGSGGGFLTIEAICLKYKVSRKTVNNKCTQFAVERKQVGRHNLVNELQFLKAHDKPAEKPNFLKNLKAA
ncbi:MAG: hypothetical protein V4511_01060 [Bacteroidota bacterium]